MKLVRFAGQTGPAIGAVVGNRVVGLAAAAVALGDNAPSAAQRFPASMAEFLARGQEGLNDAAAVAGASPDYAIFDLSSTQLLAPIGDPPKIICVGQNYRDHCLEQNQPIPERAIIFSKFTTALNDPGGTVLLPKASEQVDYEAELAFVIGTGGKDIAEADGLKHVAGYMCANDVSARDIQFADKQWVRGKSPDGFFPIGPYLVTADEIADPHDLDISLKLNGVTMQSSNTSNLIFNVPFLVSFLSQTMTLLPGDIVTTGTPGGVGVFRKPPVFLKPGDTMLVTIAGLGTLTNTVGE